MFETTGALGEDFLIAPLVIINVIMILLGAAFAVGRLVLHRHDRLPARRWADVFHCAAVVVYIPLFGANICFWNLLRNQPGYLQWGGTPYWLLSYELARTYLFYSELYLVKLSFMMLYRSLFAVDRSFRAAWWGVLTFVILTYLLILSGCGYLTFATPPNFSPESEERQSAVLKNRVGAISLNVGSDLAIMALPLGMLRSLQMSISTKLGLAAVFLLSFIIIILDLMRMPRSELQFGGEVVANLEAGLALVLCGLPVYRNLTLARIRSVASWASTILRPRRASRCEPALGIDDVRRRGVLPKRVPAAYGMSGLVSTSCSDGFSTVIANTRAEASHSQSMKHSATSSTCGSDTDGPSINESIRGRDNSSAVKVSPPRPAVLKPQ